MFLNVFWAIVVLYVGYTIYCVGPVLVEVSSDVQAIEYNHPSSLISFLYIVSLFCCAGTPYYIVTYLFFVACRTYHTCSNNNERHRGVVMRSYIVRSAVAAVLSGYHTGN